MLFRADAGRKLRCYQGSTLYRLLIVFFLSVQYHVELDSKYPISDIRYPTPIGASFELSAAGDSVEKAEINEDGDLPQSTENLQKQFL